jgi:PPM family protein phosphatase
MLRYTQISEIGYKRSGNEDSTGIFEIEEGLLAIVCDGLGGNKAGDIASKRTVEIVNEAFTTINDPDYIERIRKSIIHANKMLKEESFASEALKGMATTVEVLFIKDNGAYWGHVGDSRIYHLRNNKLRQITKDHSLVQKLVDEGLLTMKEAENHPNKNIIMRAVGDTNNLEVDASKIKLSAKEETLFFICTDGVTTVINNEELEQILCSNFDKIPEIIKEAVEKGGAPDNFSFILIKKSEE